MSVTNYPTTTKVPVEYEKDTSYLQHIINPARETAARAAVIAKAANEEKQEKAKAAKEADRLAKKAKKEADQVAKKAKKEADRVAKKAKKEFDQVAKQAKNQVAKQLQQEFDLVARQAKKETLAAAALVEGKRVMENDHMINSHRSWLIGMKAQHILSDSQVKLLCGMVLKHVAAGMVEQILQPTCSVDQVGAILTLARV